MPKIGQMERIALRAYGFDKATIDNLERSGAMLSHGHDMLSEMEPDVHAKIHPTCVNPKLDKAPPEVKATDENSLCMYRMIGFLYARKFGMEQFETSRKKYPELV